MLGLLREEYDEKATDRVSEQGLELRLDLLPHRAAGRRLLLPQYHLLP